MCIWILALGFCERYPVILAGNRDEFYARPAAPARFWDDCPGLVAGRDEAEQGTWMGVTEGGRFALLTNYRDPAAVRQGLASRGGLVRSFLCGEASAQAYAGSAARSGNEYNPFNLVVGDAGGVFWVSNRADGPRRVPPGLHGLSNHLLDTPWPKVERARRATAAACRAPSRDPAAFAEVLFSILHDETRAPDADLPDTGVGKALERVLSPVFINSPGYGTRACTVFLCDAEGLCRFEERAFTEEGPGGGSAFAFQWPGGEGSLLYRYQGMPENSDAG